MDYERKVATAMERLMPEGGWFYKDDELQFHEGVKVPSQADIDAEIARVERELPIYDELAALDIHLPRHSEDFQRGRGIEKYDRIINAKDNLRDQLKKEKKR